MILRDLQTDQAIEAPDDFLDRATIGVDLSRDELISQGAYVGFANCSEEVYRSAPYYNNSFLNTFRKSPAHAMSERLFPKKKTAALEFGTDFHTAYLERDVFEKRYCVAPRIEDHKGALVTVDDMKAALTKLGLPVSGKKADLIARLNLAAPGAVIWDDVVKEATEGKNALSPDEFDQIRGMIDAVDSHRIASRALAGGETELSLFVFDETAGLYRKVKIDHVNRDQHVLCNVKTTLDASPRAFQRDVWKYGYHRQSAGELDIYNQLTGAGTNMAYHVCVEKQRPYGVAVDVLDDASIEKGQFENTQLLARVKECHESGKWPCYSDEIIPAALPAYAWDQEE